MLHFLKRSEQDILKIFGGLCFLFPFLHVCFPQLSLSLGTKGDC